LRSFDFVVDEDLRQSLEADAAEMDACIEAHAHKAAVVLAGSIVEALLADHLATLGYVDAKGVPILELDLGQLIAAARTQKQVSSKTADLASAVKNYRNLIHPGRLVREKESVNDSTAIISAHLVDLIAREIAELKRDTYGYTSQQLLRKIENDSSSMAIVTDLLKTTKEKEVDRLLLQDLPSRYLELDAQSEYVDDTDVRPTLARFKAAYRAALAVTSDATKRRVATNHARILREEVSEFEVLTHESAFFRAYDLDYMADSDRMIAKKHLLAQVGRVVPDRLMESLEGIGQFLDETELIPLVDAFIRYVSTRDTPSRRQTIANLLQRLYQETPTQIDPALRNRLQSWEKTFESRDGGLSDWIAEQRSAMEPEPDYEDLPF
jgi:mRNA-degrading endonuclease toxin of MazEF toxin-antitoxin module